MVFLSIIPYYLTFVKFLGRRRVTVKLDCLWGLVGGDCRTSVVLWPLASLVKQLRQWDRADAEDQRIVVLEYLYQCYCVRAIVKYLTESEWRVAAVQLRG